MSTRNGQEIRPGRTGDLTGFVHSLAAEPTVDQAMVRLTAYTADRVPAALAAGLTVCTGAGPATRAATSRLVEPVDALQYMFGGPCVTALHEAEPIHHADDLEADDRWPEFAAAAVEQTPVRSVLSYRLGVRPEHAFASLNLYASASHAFAPTIVRETAELASQAAVALAYLVERQARLNLEIALDSNRRIGAALGIVMARYGLTHDQALRRLNKASQDANRKLRDLAEQIIETGELPSEGVASVRRTA